MSTKSRRFSIRNFGYIEKDPLDNKYYLYVTNPAYQANVKQHLIPRKTKYDKKKNRIYVGHKYLGSGYSRVVFQLTEKTCLKIDKRHFIKSKSLRTLDRLNNQNENEYYASMNLETIDTIRPFICRVKSVSTNSFFFIEQEYFKGMKKQGSPLNKMTYKGKPVRQIVIKLSNEILRHTGFDRDFDLHGNNVLVVLKEDKTTVTKIKVCDLGFLAI